MERIARNKPCPCGSGKKYKMCCLNKKPRTEQIYIGHKEKFTGIKSDNHGNTLIKTDSGDWIKPDSVFTQTTYERDSGKDKVLNLVPDIAIGVWERDIAHKYDAVWAIDTNTKNIDGENVSVATIVEAYFDNADSGKIVLLRWRISGSIAFKNAAKGNEEKFAWCKLIGRITASPNYDMKQQVAIITDHDLGVHKLLNEHEVPIVDATNSYLPKNFTLVYASTDSGVENRLNWLLAKCDKEAERILKLFEKQGYCEDNGTRISINDIPVFDIDKYKGEEKRSGEEKSG